MLDVLRKTRQVLLNIIDQLRKILALLLTIINIAITIIAIPRYLETVAVEPISAVLGTMLLLVIALFVIITVGIPMFFIFPIAPLYIIAYIDSRVMKSSIKDTIKRYVSKKIDFFLKHLGLLRIGNASKSLRDLKDRLTSIVEEKT